MISAGSLAQLQRESNRFLPDSGVIQRLTLTADAYGGQTEVWADLATMACRVSPTAHFAQSEPMVADRTVQQTEYTVTLAAGTDVTARDRIVWQNRVLQVVSVVSRSWEISRRVQCIEQV